MDGHRCSGCSRLVSSARKNQFGVSLITKRPCGVRLHFQAALRIETTLRKEQRFPPTHTHTSAGLQCPALVLSGLEPGPPQAPASSASTSPASQVDQATVMHLYQTQADMLFPVVPGRWHHVVRYTLWSRLMRPSQSPSLPILARGWKLPFSIEMRWRNKARC